MLAFYLTTDPNTVQTVNQGQIMVLAGTSNNYMCAIVYAGGEGVPPAQSPFELSGVCQVVGKNFTPIGTSQILFTQTRLSGGFSTTS